MTDNLQKDLVRCENCEHYHPEDDNGCYKRTSYSGSGEGLRFCSNWKGTDEAWRRFAERFFEERRKEKQQHEDLHRRTDLRHE